MVDDDSDSNDDHDEGVIEINTANTKEKTNPAGGDTTTSAKGHNAKKKKKNKAKKKSKGYGNVGDSDDDEIAPKSFSSNNQTKADDESRQQSVIDLVKWIISLLVSIIAWIFNLLFGNKRSAKKKKTR
jgi:hypothetical protein